MKRAVAALAVLSLAGCGESEEVTALRKARDENLALILAENAKRPLTPSSVCSIGKEVPRNELALNSTYEILRTPDGEKLYNAKASAALNKPHYHRIDESTTVAQKCADGSWTLVRITSPSWLAGIEGWAPNSIFRNIERSADGARNYVEEDVYWDEHSNPYRQKIVAKINELSHEDRCKQIDPQTVALSPTRGSKYDPVFFVTCGSGAQAFNVWFNVN